MLEAKTKEQKAQIKEILGNAPWWELDEEDCDGIFIDDSFWISFDMMAAVVDYLRSKKRMSNPDIPIETILKQTLKENRKLKSEMSSLKTELSHKDTAIKNFRIWQGKVVERNHNYWLLEGLKLLKKPPISDKATRLINGLLANEESYRQRTKRNISMYKKYFSTYTHALENEEIKSLLEDKEIQQLLKETEEE